MKAEDQLAHLIGTNHGYGGGDGAKALAKSLRDQAMPAGEKPARRWKPSKPKKTTPQ